MRKTLLLLLALLLFLPAIPAAAEKIEALLPKECIEMIQAEGFDGYRVTSWHKPDENTVVAILHKDSRNVLVLFEAVGGSFTIALTTDKAVPQGKNDAHVFRATGNYSMSGKQRGTAFGVNYAPDDGEAWNDVVIWELKNKSWHAVSYHTDQPEFVTLEIEEGKLVFLDDGWTDEKTTTVYGAVETNLKLFDLAAFPKSVEEARKKLSHPSADNALKPEGLITPDFLYGTYAFTKQLYMNPLSSFLAFDGFEEYYELTENTLIFTDASGQKRSLKITWHEEAVDAKAYKSSFMIEEAGIPDITAYRNRRQFTLVPAGRENIVYRIYLMDDEVWLAQIHRDSANAQRPEYIWSIFKVEKYFTSLSVQGTQAGVKDFLALLGDKKPQMYEGDTCYNITTEAIAAATGYRVFKFDTSCASYLKYENEIYQLGEWFGGLGVVSMTIADFNGDGLSELYFTYSFGSGLHRSNAGYFDPATKELSFLPYGLLNKDMVVVENKTGGLSLYKTAFPFFDSFVDYRALGTEYIADIVFQNGNITLYPLPKSAF